MASHYVADPTVLNFAIRKPVRLTLKYDDPKECSAPGRFMFSLAGDHKDMRTFVSRPVVEQIFALGIKAGQPFWIEKRGKDEFAVSLQRPENSDERLNRQLRESVAPDVEPGWENGFHGELAVPKGGDEKKAAGLVEPAASPIHKAPAAATAPASIQVPSQSTLPRAETQIEDGLFTVIRACYRAHEYARQIGYASMPQFSGEDIRAMAISLVINREREKQRAA